MVETEEERAKEREIGEKKFRKLIVKKETEIARMIEKKQNEEEDLIEIRVVEKMISRRFHKYLKVFKKKKLGRMPIRKIWDYAINFREEFCYGTLNTNNFLFYFLLFFLILLFFFFILFSWKNNKAGM